MDNFNFTLNNNEGDWFQNDFFSNLICFGIVSEMKEESEEISKKSTVEKKQTKKQFKKKE